MISLTDRLAVMRTELANERTLLAYVRTALATAGGGVALAQIFQGPLLTTLGLGLVAAGTVGLLVGVVRYRRVKQDLRAVETHHAGLGTTRREGGEVR